MSKIPNDPMIARSMIEMALSLLLCILILAVAGCADRRFMRIEADSIDVSAGAATALTSIPEIHAKGLRIWIVTGDKKLDFPRFLWTEDGALWESIGQAAVAK